MTGRHLAGPRTDLAAAKADLRLELARAVLAHGPHWTKVIAAEAERIIGGTPTAARYRQAADLIARRREQGQAP